MCLDHLRDLFDRTGIGVVLVGMPGIEKRLSRYPQLYSRVGFAHHYRPLQGDELAFVLTRHWRQLGLSLDGADFTDAQASAAIARITGGNFRLLHRLAQAIEAEAEVFLAAMTDTWLADYARWQRRDLSGRRYVYVWADGIYLQARMEPQAECMLVLIGATPEGKKELVGFQVGVRESAQSWRELLISAKYEKAATCLVKDRDALLSFYDFPAEHWDHLRTSNPIESVFATVRHRTVRTKGALSQDTARLMVFKLVMAAAKTWHRLKGENQFQGRPKHHIPQQPALGLDPRGVEVTTTPKQHVA